MKMTVFRRCGIVVGLAGFLSAFSPPGITAARNQGQGAAPGGISVPDSGQAANQSPAPAPARSPDQYPMPVQNPPPSPVSQPSNPQSPGQPAQAPRQNPDLYPSQTPRMSPESSPLQSPAQNPGGFPPSLSSSTALPGQGTGQMPVFSSSTAGGQPPMPDRGTIQQGTTTTIQSPPGLPSGTTSFSENSRDEDFRFMRRESRLPGTSPVNRAIEEKSPEGVESDCTFQKDTLDRLERVGRQVDGLRMKAQDLPPDRRVAFDRKIDELRRDGNDVRTMLQDAFAPAPPKTHWRSATEEALERLEQRSRAASGSRSYPAGEKGKEDFTFEQRDDFRRAIEAQLDNLQKSIDGLARNMQQTAGAQKQALRQRIDELERQRTALRRKLDRLTAVSRESWDRVKKDIAQGLGDLERTLQSAETQQERAGEEGGGEKPRRR